MEPGPEPEPRPKPEPRIEPELDQGSTVDPADILQVLCFYTPNRVNPQRPHFSGFKIYIKKIGWQQIIPFGGGNLLVVNFELLDSK